MVGRIPLKALVVAFAFSVSAVSPLMGQSATRDYYVAIEAGMAAQPDQFSVRSQLGAAVAFGAGRYFSTHAAVEARLGADFFAAPTQFISPGGCLGQGPCNPPRASPVHITTLAGDWVFSNRQRGTAPLILAGLGLRRITESPATSPEVRPFAEVGAGIVHSLTRTSIGLEARWQLAPSRADLPRWTLPIGVNIRLF